MPVARGKDKQGPFYRWGKTGKKYHYTARNVKQRNAAKRKAYIQGYAITQSEKRRGTAVDGEGFTDYLPAFIRNRLPTIRKQAPPIVRDWVAKKGNTRITQVVIYRIPLRGPVRSFIDIATAGGFEKAKKALGYDHVFHLFMLVSFADGTHLRIDKNQVVHIEQGQRTDNGEFRQAYNLARVPPFNLKQFFENGEKASGSAERYWVYSPVNPTWNCQQFVIDTLQGNGLLTPDIKTFVLQDADKLVTSPFVQKILGGLTGIAARADRVLHGEGFVPDRISNPWLPPRFY